MRVGIRAARLNLVVYGSYLLVTLYLTWPLVTVFSTRLIGHPFGDSYEYIGLIWWFKHALQSGASLFYQPLLAYPDGLSAALLWSIPLQSFPAWLFAFVMPLPAAFNLSFLLTLALNGWSAFYLVHYLTKSRAAGWLAGLVFMTYPTFQGHLAAGHLGLLALWGIPLYVHALLRLRESRSWRWVAQGALFLVVSLLGNSVIAVYMLLPLTGAFIAARLLRREWALLGRTILTALLGFLAGLVFLLPAALDTLSSPARVNERNDIAFSADLLAIVSPSFQHPLFSGLAYPHRVLGVDPFEKIAYSGMAAGVLVMLAIWRRREAWGWLLVGAAVWVLSLGPVLKILDTPVSLSIEGYDTMFTLPWLFAQNIPLLNISRTPARFNFTLALVVAVLAGYGAAWLWTWLGGRKRIRAVVSLVVVGFILIEYPFFWSKGLPEMPTLPGVVPSAIAGLADRADVRAVFDIPWEHLLTDKEAMFLQSGHQHALLAGHIARRTPVDPAQLSLLQGTLDPALLRGAGADIIILHKHWDEGKIEAEVRAALGAPFYEDAEYALFERPEIEEQPSFTTLITPLTEISDQADSYLYAPQPGWTLFSGSLQAEGREVGLYLNEERIYGWDVEGSAEINVPLFLGEGGYYTVRLALEPACPVSDNPTLICNTAGVSDLAFGEFVPETRPTTVAFEGGINLGAARMRYEEGSVTTWLSWDFENAREESDVRFVHIVNEAGVLVGQDDHSLGAQAAGTGRDESVVIALPGDLLPGEYRVSVGWYSFPEIRPFAILADLPDAGSGSLEIGRFSR